MTTEEILSHHLQSFGKGDVDAIMEDYTEESVFITQTDTLVGLAAIRTLFEALTTVMLPPGSKFEMEKQEISGDVAYISWKAESDSHIFHLGTDTFIIENGKIAKQTFAGYFEEKS